MKRAPAATRRLTLLAAFLTVVCYPAAPARAQKCEGAISGAVSRKNSTTIFVKFQHALAGDDELRLVETPAQWLLNDLFVPPPPAPGAASAPAPAPVTILRVEREPLGDPRVTDVKITLSRALDPDHTYHLAAPNLRFEGCKPKKIPQALVGFRESTRDPDDKPNFFPRTAAKGRDDSNVYLSGSVEGAEGGSPQVSADVKLEIPKDVDWGIFKSTAPYFNLKASTSEEADANSLNFGGKISAPFNIGSRLDPATGRPRERLLRGINWHVSGGFESDRRFDNVNVITDNRVAFVTRGAGVNDTFLVKPFVGFELGRNLKSPVAEAEDRAVARGYFGANLYVSLYPADAELVSLEVDYIRRFLLKREIYFREDDDKNLLPLNVGRGPRDHLKTSLNFGVSDFTGIQLSYEYGSLPPNFQLVNHKYSVGLVYKFKTKFPE